MRHKQYNVDTGISYIMNVVGEIKKLLKADDEEQTMDKNSVKTKNWLSRAMLSKKSCEKGWL